MVENPYYYKDLKKCVFVFCFFLRMLSVMIKDSLIYLMKIVPEIKIELWKHAIILCITLSNSSLWFKYAGEL